jgi:hypothetical protein
MHALGCRQPDPEQLSEYALYKGLLWTVHGTDKPSAMAGSGNIDFTTELIVLMGLALTDAFCMGFMDAANFLFIEFLLFNRLLKK